MSIALVSLLTGFGCAGPLGAIIPAAAAEGDASSGASSDGEAEPVSSGDPAAAIVLGSTIDTVQRPNSVSDLAVSLGSAFEDGVVPTSYAVEVAPFWLSRRASEVSLREYAAPGMRSAIYNMNVSFAAANETDVGVRTAVAVRTTVWGKPLAGSSIAEFRDEYDALVRDGSTGKIQSRHACVQTLGHLSSFAAALGAGIREQVTTTMRGDLFLAQQAAAEACSAVDGSRTPQSAARCKERGLATAQGSTGGEDPASDAVILKSLDSLFSRLDELTKSAAGEFSDIIKREIDSLVKNPSKLEGELQAYLKEVGFDDAFTGCADLMNDRTGLVVDLALGASIAAPEQKLTSLDADSVTLWVTPGYLWEHSSLFGVARITGESLGSDPIGALTLGGGWGYQWESFALSLAGAGRLPIGGEQSATAMGSVSGDIQFWDGAWFSSGVEISLPGDEPGSFVTFGGFKLGVAGERTLSNPTMHEMAALVK